MAAAIESAKTSFHDFVTAFNNPKEGQSAFLIKAAFCDGDEVEHVWLADLELSAQRVRGVVANEPKMKTLRFKATVECEPAQITDWMYIENGHLVGGFTTRLIRERMNPEERAAFDANSPFTF